MIFINWRKVCYLWRMSAQLHIVPYDPAWPLAYEQERDRLSACLGELSPRIEHIGSTAVQGLGGEPMIDLLLGFPAAAAVAEAMGPLLAAGYQPCPYPSGLAEQLDRSCARLQDGRRSDADGKWGHCLHLAVAEAPFWQQHIALRDYLRRHPLARDAYYRMKIKLARGLWEGEEGYAQAKHAFMQRMEWFAGLRRGA